MNEISNTFLLAGDKFMPEMHLRNKSFKMYLSTLMRDLKDLQRRTNSEKLLRDKTFNGAKNPKYDGYHRDLAQWFRRRQLNFLL